MKLKIIHKELDCNILISLTSKKEFKNMDMQIKT
jgi:hypothetical protein